MIHIYKNIFLFGIWVFKIQLSTMAYHAIFSNTGHYSSARANLETIFSPFYKTTVQ